MLPIIIAAKVGIKYCRFATECVSFVHVCMQLANQLELGLHERTQIVASAACRVGSQEFPIELLSNGQTILYFKKFVR